MTAAWTPTNSAASRTLHSTGNVVVKGRLVMRPAAHEVDHLLVFEGVDEGRLDGRAADVERGDEAAHARRLLSRLRLTARMMMTPVSTPWT